MCPRQETLPARGAGGGAGSRSTGSEGEGVSKKHQAIRDIQTQMTEVIGSGYIRRILGLGHGHLEIRNLLSNSNCITDIWIFSLQCMYNVTSLYICRHCASMSLL
jgi:hypothetical protein